MTTHLIFKPFDCTIGSDFNLYSRCLLLDNQGDLYICELIQSGLFLLIPCGRYSQAFILFSSDGWLTSWHGWHLGALLLHLTLHIGDVDGSCGGSLLRRQQLLFLLLA